LEWRLNRTKNQDQHQKLQILQARGFDVYYALPLFHTAAELSANRYRLLLNTFWMKPLSIKPKGGPTGYHEVRFDSSSGMWTVLSGEPTDIEEPPFTVAEVASHVFARDSSTDYVQLAQAVNVAILGEAFPDGNFASEEEGLGLDSDFSGLCILST
jgi:hypothetical protein